MTRRWFVRSVALVGALAVTTVWAGVPAHGADTAVDSAHAFAAKIEVGAPGSTDARGCSGALVHPQWVITSAACFARPGSPVPTGAPQLATTVIVGRPDLSTRAGHALAAVQVVAHPDRDVAVVKLAAPVTGVKPVTLGTGAPAAGEVLQVAGYGRTRTEWVPTHQHASEFTVGSSTATSAELVNRPGATVCKGDAGAPVLRGAAGAPSLVAVATGSGQRGCLAVADDAPTGATSARVDDLRSWIWQNTAQLPPSQGADPEAASGRWADFDGDGKADYIVIDDGGAVRVFLNRGGGFDGWQSLGVVATGVVSDRTKVRWADFDGDRKADYLVFADNGALSVFLNRGGDGRGGWQNLGLVATGAVSDRTKVRWADFDGDRKADYFVFADNGAISVFLNRGGDGRGGWQNLGLVATGAVSDRTKVRWADFDGDRKADYFVFADNGAISVFLNRGGDGRGGWQNLGLVATGAISDRTKIRWADFDGDGKDDYLIANEDGSVRVFLNRGGDGRGGWGKDTTIAS
ncbi:VCBS repeat protein [Krasilnikovia cinnamomea]|uniref:VCBS repeat protein n=1 Tax=Krasilnikovia cinnamomea TaxID=349313 RepID=A0A4Q7ZN65_9ACTN|nr:FG-GAP-like repeat-containing protein [Krasilnikovia cinnamomea]RZU52094.1 VCBS repeat protein [Krasilnikovia cinnamomea]